MNNKIYPFVLLNKVNPVIRLMIASDIMFIMSRLGLVYPVLAVFITDQIKEGNLEVVGISTTIFLLSKSLMQIPISTILDKIKGEIDDFWVMFAGSFLLALLPLLYISVDSAPWLYFTQFIYGLASAMAFPSWMALFTRHIDKEHEGIEWSLYFSLTDLATAAAATIGGIIAYRYGFKPLFISASAISFLGLAVLYGVRGLLKTK